MFSLSPGTFLSSYFMHHTNLVQRKKFLIQCCMSNISYQTCSYLLISSESQHWYAKAEQNRKAHGRTTQHSTAQCWGKQKWENEPGKGRDTGKCHFLPDLGTILKYFYKNTGEEGSKKKKKKSDRGKKKKNVMVEWVTHLMYFFLNVTLRILYLAIL